MSAVRVIHAALRDRWRYRGIRYRPPRTPRVRVHWKRVEFERWRAEDLGVDRKGRVVCRPCGGFYERGHECPFP